MRPSRTDLITFFSSAWHRFVQPDPSDGSYSLSNPQSFNRYAYVQNNPVNLVDPSGLLPQVCPPELSGPECLSSWNPIPGININEHRSPTPGTLDTPNGPIVLAGGRTGMEIIDYTFSTSVTLWAVFRGIQYTASEGNEHAVFWWEKAAWRVTKAFGTTSWSTGMGGSKSAGGATTPKSPSTPTLPPGGCNNDNYVSYTFSLGAFLMGGSVSLIANGKGMFLQLGGGTAFSTQVAGNGILRSPLFRVNRPGPSFSIRVSDSGVSEGFGTQMDFGMYSRSWDSQGNASNEYGFGLPGVSQQGTYTYRFYYGNCSN